MAPNNLHNRGFQIAWSDLGSARCQPFHSALFAPAAGIMQVVWDHVSSFDTYRWSSYREYMGQEGYIDQDISYGIFGSPFEFKEYMADSRPMDYRPSWRMRISDDDVLPAGEALLRSQFGISRHEVQELPKGRRCEVICTLRDEGFSTNQIQLLTGLGEWVIKKARHTARSPA